MAVLYVRSSGGSDANSGLSFALGKATISGALSAMSNNDTMIVCADGTHLPTAGISITALTNIFITGGNSTGGDDGTVATISGASLPGSTSLFTFQTATGFRATFRNIRMTAAKNAALNLVGNQGLILSNCRIDGSTQMGCYMDNASANISCFNCSFDANGGGGVIQSTTNRGAILAFGCVFANNNGVGINLGAGIRLYNCLVYKNTSHGITTNGIAQLWCCTIDGNSGNGIEGQSGAVISGCNNILSNNGGFGLDHNGTVRTTFLAWQKNWYYNNTSGAVDLNSGDPTNTDFTFTSGTDPLFVSRTGGSEDYSLSSSSTARGAGFPGAMWSGGTGSLSVGALQPSGSGGGGLRRVFSGGVF